MDYDVLFAEQESAYEAIRFTVSDLAE